MTGEQAIVFSILGVALVLFVWERLRYDLVALLALLASVILGVVPADSAFSGFADPAVITVAAVLVISRAIRNSGLIERVLRPLDPWLGRVDLQVLLLGGLVALFSAFMNNVGALAVFLPAALEVARRHGTPAAAVLMPMAFASLLGGLITLIGTPPNILISAVRRDTLGEPFGMFSFAPIGVPLTLAGLALLTVAWRLLPTKGRAGTAEEAFRIDDYLSEVTLPDSSPMVGRTVGDLESMTEGTFRVLALQRPNGRRAIPTRAWVLRGGDRLELETEPKALEQAVAEYGLELAGSKELPLPPGDRVEVGVMEAIVGGESPLVGRTPSELGLRERYGVNLLAVSRRGARPVTRLKGFIFQTGDVLMLQGPVERMREQLSGLGALPLAVRDLRVGARRVVWLPILAMVAAVTATTFGLLPPSVAFMTAVAALLLGGAIRLDEAYESVSWPVIVLLGALIPVSGAMQTTGGTDLIAGFLGQVTQGLAPVLALGLVMLATMLVTPVLNNAATVLLMAPIAAGYAKGIGLAVDPFLMAVAVGASSDFLTPIGHQSNTLVMGPGGYRFADYPRLGLPLSVLVLTLGTLLISWVWPVYP